ncbi:MAG: aminotransferase class I/II-fold pyridoxal phosphate-dependent enzyme [Deferribacteraceae bacterium]|jgi:aspartate/methionine/tyrosine aminotransferase|nr:aminotransferase class I/II-fold pyridoxal phosphate-dependent enzyme [Deferribacteraceae bacterium]
MNPLAIELNDAIHCASESALKMLSKLGLELYMPKGIITQAAQAKQKAYKYNATLGIATRGGKPFYLPCIYNCIDAFPPEDLFSYAPTKGVEELREAWKEKILRDNPSLQADLISLPIVTNALTHGLSITADLFCNEGDYLVTPNKFWGNYRLIFSVRRGANISTFNTFDGVNFNVNGLLEKVEECGKLKGKVIVLLNFPNNPAGYTPTEQEALDLAQGLKKIADSGVQLVCITDDAYFGMFYSNCFRQSIFSLLSGISPNILSVKLDAATKEMFVWGFRVGFITFSAPSGAKGDILLHALEKKVEGLIRGTISNCSHPSQSMVLRALKHPSLTDEINENVAILTRRAAKTKEIVSHPKYRDRFIPYPFNSGYFLCIKIEGVDAEDVRLRLLDRYGIGVIAASSTDLRIAFSSVEEENLEDLFNTIYNAIGETREISQTKQ